jgi:hypothetical protein
MSKPLVALAVLAALVLGGCAGSGANPNTPAGRKVIQREADETAATRAKQGDPCEAAQIDTPIEGEPSVAERRYRKECTDKKNEEAREKEVHNAEETVRESERLKGEGR